MAPVEVADIAATKVAHESCARRRIRDGREKVHMVRHETVRVNSALVATAVVREKRKVGEIVAFSAEARVTVVAPLDNVQRDAGKDEPWMACHTARTAPRHAG